MRTLRISAVLLLAFAALFATPAKAEIQSETFQFTFFWTAREFTFTDTRVVVTVTNNITNKIGGNGEVIDTYRITLGDQRIEVTEKHDARDYIFDIVGTQTIRLEGIDRGFWAGDWGPIMTVTQEVVVAPEPSPEPTPEPTPEEVTPSVSEAVTEPPIEVAPPQPSAAEVKEIAEDVLAEYDAFWARHGISEADYSQARQVITFNWAKAQYLQLISEGKRTKATIAALSMQSQIKVIERDYLAGRLMPNPAVLPEPAPAPEVQTSSPEPIVPEPLPTPPVETNPEETSQPTPTPSVPEPQPSVEPRPTLPIAPERPTTTQSPAPLAPVVTESPQVSQSESSEVTSESSSVSEEIVEVPEASESDSVSEAVPTSPQEAIGAVISLFATAGLDMTPEQREAAQGVVVPSVIAAQVATLAMRRIK
jgi:hypothetical protein